MARTAASEGRRNARMQRFAACSSTQQSEDAKTDPRIPKPISGEFWFSYCGRGGAGGGGFFIITRGKRLYSFMKGVLRHCGAQCETPPGDSGSA